LPDLKPKDIINSRSIKFNFSGDIDKSICTNPFFFDTEKIYLRAQIARISMNTAIVPKSLYRLQEENKREIEDNAPEEGEIVKPSVPDMCDINKWAHYQPSILLQGKVTHKEGKPLEGEEEVEPEVLLAREVLKDPWEDRLKLIVKDNKTLGNMPAWNVRSYNVKDYFMDPKTKKSSVNYGTVVLKSMWWPGSVTFYNNQRTQFIYCGDGQKYEVQSYYPIDPPVMMAEKDEVKCYDEPNPTEAWLK
jgi:radial spoke head protein 4A